MLLAAALLALVLADAPATAQEDPGRIGIRLLEAPVERAEDPRAHRYIIDHLQPGATISRRVEVLNDTSDTLPVEFYAGAAEIREGQWRPADGRAQNELTSWISVEPSTVNVPPGGSVEAMVTIDVDAAASAGEHYAVIWAQPPAGQQGGATVVNRVGIRVYLSVGPGGEPAVDFEITGLRAARADDGTPVVEVAVRNTGGRALDLRGELELTDGPGGISAGPFPVPPRTTVAIGERASVLVPLDPELPRGPWQATATLTSGTVERSASAQVIFPEVPGEATKMMPPDERGPGWNVLVPLAGVLLGLVIAFWLMFVLTGRRRDDDDDADGSTDVDDREPMLVGS